jgi:hypothetical protein
MVAIGLYIRLGIVETPTFSRLVAENRIEKAPALEVIKRQPKEDHPDGIGPDRAAGAFLHFRVLCFHLRRNVPA